MSTNILRNELLNNTPLYFAGCHDALSAMIAEQAGFGALWVSSLCLSAVQGRRDFGEVSWSEVVAATEKIADKTTSPILVDGDSGHGDFNIARLFAQKITKAGAVGLAIEDQVFPKRNSLMEAKQELEDVGVFSGKIKAIKDAVGESLCLISRLESLIVGHGVDEAIERGSRYVEAGADAVLIHSKCETAEQIMQFIKQWDNKTPVVIVPTTYYPAIKPHVESLGVNGIIWANQLLRAQAHALRSVAEHLYEAKDFANISNMDNVKDIMKMTQMDQINEERLIYGNC